MRRQVEMEVFIFVLLTFRLVSAASNLASVLTVVVHKHCGVQIGLPTTLPHSNVRFNTTILEAPWSSTISIGHDVTGQISLNSPDPVAPTSPTREGNASATHSTRKPAATNSSTLTTSLPTPKQPSSFDWTSSTTQASAFFTLSLRSSNIDGGTRPFATTTSLKDRMSYRQSEASPGSFSTAKSSLRSNSSVGELLTTRSKPGSSSSTDKGTLQTQTTSGLTNTDAFGSRTLESTASSPTPDVVSASALPSPQNASSAEPASSVPAVTVTTSVLDMVTTTFSPVPTATCAVASASNITCPESNGTLFTPEGDCVDMENFYIIDCGQDYTSVNLQVVPDITNATSCVSQCSNDDSCVEVAFDNTTHTCYEKSSVIFGNTNLNATTSNLVFAFNLRYALDFGNAAASSLATDLTPATTTSMEVAVITTTQPASVPATSAPEPSTPSQPFSHACPTYDGSDLTAEDGTEWLVHCDIVYGTLTLQAFSIGKRQDQVTAVDCASSCGDVANCFAFSCFGGQCNLFNGYQENSTTLDGALSARRASGILVLSSG